MVLGLPGMRLWRLGDLAEALGVSEERTHELCIALHLEIRPASGIVAGPTVRLAETQFHRLRRLVRREP